MAPGPEAMYELLHEQLDLARRVLELNRAMAAELQRVQASAQAPDRASASSYPSAPASSVDPLSAPHSGHLPTVLPIKRVELADNPTRQPESAPHTLREPQSEHAREPLLATESMRSLATDQSEWSRKSRRQRTKTIFTNIEEIKKNLKEHLTEKEYNVEELYHETGCAQKVARSDVFKHMAFGAIFLNAIWIAIDVDTNKADVLSDAPMLNQVVENIFCCFFLLELSIRYFAFKEKWRAFKDGWFLFDLLLVLMMVWGTWVNVFMYWLLQGSGQHFTSIGNYSAVFRVFRLLRLTRVARLARLLREVPELMVLARGMFLAIKSVFSTLCMLLLIIYFFALFLTQLLWDTEPGRDCFENVPQAVNCLLVGGVFADQTDFIRKMLEAGWMYYLLILLYLVMGSLTILNMLIGMMAQVISVAAQLEKEEVHVQRIRDKLMELVLPGIDRDQDGRVSKEEFVVLIKSPYAMKQLLQLEVDVVAMVELADAIFSDEEDMSFDDFVKVVVQLRGSNTATVKDIVDVRKYISMELTKLEERILLPSLACQE